MGASIRSNDEENNEMDEKEIHLLLHILLYNLYG